MTQDKPRVLIMTHYDLERGSGGDIAKLKNVRGILSSSCNVGLFGFRYFSDQRKYSWPFLAPYWFASLARRVLAGSWHVIYCINDRYSVIILSFLRIALVKKYKIMYSSVLTWKLVPSSKIRVYFREIVEHLAGKSADVVVAVSELSENFFSKYTETLLIPNPVDTEVFRQVAGKKSEIRTKLGIDSHEKIIGLVGPFDQEYNGPMLAFMRDNISKFDNKIKFLVIGEGLGQCKMEHRNIIYTGFVDDYVSYLSAVDALLVIRHIPTDGPIHRIIQAMAMKLPVYANPVAAKTVEHAAPGVNMFVFDESELPRKIGETVFDDALLKEIGENSRRAVEENYCKERYAKDLISLIKTFLS